MSEDIEREAQLCREACKDVKIGDLMSHIHHGQWLEELTEPIENRIAFILVNKDPEEQAERLRRMRPFDWKKADADWEKADADWKKADADWEKADAAPAMLKVHAEVCGCPWGPNTDIFGAKR